MPTMRKVRPQQRRVLGDQHSGGNVDEVLADGDAHSAAQQQKELDDRHEGLTVLLKQFMHLRRLRLSTEHDDQSPPASRTSLPEAVVFWNATTGATTRSHR